MKEPKTRQLVKIVKEICEENEIDYKSFSETWIIQLTASNGNKSFIYGYKFSNNDSAISRICDDKAALSSVLIQNDIPCVEHYFVERPDISCVNKKVGLFEILSKMLEKKGKLVIKSNFGSGGNNVYKCENIIDVEKATFSILKDSRSMTVCPFVDIKNEYRNIIVGNKILLMYSKQRPYVIGDGLSTIRELAKKDCMENLDITNDVDLEAVPAEGEKVELSWKHNLGKGSLPLMIKDRDTIKEVGSFALNVAKLLNLKFASIDVIRDENNQLKILEINSGIMMENFSKLSEENYEISKDIYKAAIFDSLNLKLSENVVPVFENKDNLVSSIVKRKW